MPRTQRDLEPPRIVMLAVTRPALELAAATLREQADRHRRVGVELSGDLEDRRLAGEDIRQGALQVVRVLADADALIELAEGLETGWAGGAVGGPEALVHLRVQAGPVIGHPVVGVDGELEAIDLDDPDILAARRLLGLVPPLPPDDLDDEEPSPGDGEVASAEPEAGS